YPDLAGLKTAKQPAYAWYGRVANPQLLVLPPKPSPVEQPPTSSPTERQPPGRPHREVRRFKRESVFGASAFEFKDLEIIGFRINVRRGDDADGRRLLSDLIQDLNFHRQPAPGSVPAVDDFLYEPATSTIVVELARYGKMKSKAPLQPLQPD